MWVVCHNCAYHANERADVIEQICPLMFVQTFKILLEDK